MMRADSKALRVIVAMQSFAGHATLGELSRRVDGTARTCS